MVLVLAACSSQQTRGATGESSAGSTVQAVARPSRLTLAIQNDISVLASKLMVGPGRSGGVGEEFSFLSNSPLVVLDGRGVAHPRLAVELPSQDHGTWVVNADTTMATTWKIRPNAFWHDGQPVRSRDFVFALKIYSDPEIPTIDRHPERLILGVEPIDDKTFVIHWRQLYLSAAELTIGQLEPLPEHVLAQAYEGGDKTAFTNSPFWTTAVYVGAGPYVLQDRTEGVDRMYRAFDRYFLGRPKVDEILVRMLPDQNTALANVLGGAINTTLASAINAPSAQALQQEWGRTGDGQVVVSLNTFQFIEFQHRPEFAQPTAILDVRVRRAVAHAVDRVAMNDVLTGGRVPLPPDVPLHPEDPWSPQLLPLLPYHTHDPRQALALLADAGWTRVGDRLVNEKDEQFRVNIRTVARSDNEMRIRTVAGYVSALGADVSQYMLSVTEDGDREARAKFPGMDVYTSPMSLPDGLRDFTSRECPAPENQFFGRNRSCWSNPEFDRLFVVATTTLDRSARAGLTGDMLKILAEDVPFFSVPYATRNQAVRKGLVGPVPTWHAQPGATWNIHEWHFS